MTPLEGIFAKEGISLTAQTLLHHVCFAFLGPANKQVCVNGRKKAKKTKQNLKQRI